jgi:hypothetical protein
VLLVVEALRTSDQDVVTARPANGELSFSVGLGWYWIRLPLFGLR